VAVQSDGREHISDSLKYVEEDQRDGPALRKEDSDHQTRRVALLDAVSHALFYGSQLILVQHRSKCPLYNTQLFNFLPAHTRSRTTAVFSYVEYFFDANV